MELDTKLIKIAFKDSTIAMYQYCRISKYKINVVKMELIINFINIII